MTDPAPSEQLDQERAVRENFNYILSTLMDKLEVSPTLRELLPELQVPLQAICPGFKFRQKTMPAPPI